MSDNLAKTISTVAIWASTSLLFIFGVFRFNWDGVLPGMFWTAIALALALVPTLATQAIWNSPAAENPRKIEAGESLKGTISARL